MRAHTEGRSKRRGRGGVPEGFIPAHPVWFRFHPATSPVSLALNFELAKNSVMVSGPEIDAIAGAAAAAGAYVVIGVC
ncbi:MAG: hypothetical protein ACRDRN_12700 [Sciscionella sp.]